MFMSEENDKLKLIPFENTAVLKIRSEDSTLLVDTASELTKGYHWLNILLAEVLGQRFVEQIEDVNGEIRDRTKFHPLTMKLIEERRKTIQQIYQISGGQLRNEVTKEFGKVAARMIFEASKHQETKNKYKERAIEIIEADFNDGSKS